MNETVTDRKNDYRKKNRASKNVEQYQTTKHTCNWNPRSMRDGGQSKRIIRRDNRQKVSKNNKRHQTRSPRSSENPRQHVYTSLHSCCLPPSSSPHIYSPSDSHSLGSGLPSPTLVPLPHISQLQSERSFKK